MHRTATAALLLLLTALPALAAGGRIPIYELPLTISEPGSYYLTSDLTQSGAGEAIVLQSSDVTIDFNGHTLTKENAGNYAIALSGDYTNITIRNGTLRGGNIGIRLSNTVGGDFTTRIEDMTIQDTLNEGIYIQGQALIGSSQTYLERNLIHDVGNDGIHLRFLWGGRVAENVIQSAGDDGIYGHSLRGVTLTHNTVSHSTGDGIRLYYSWYCAVDWNHLTYNGGWAFNIFQGDQHIFSNNRGYGNSSGLNVPGGEGHVNAGGNYPAP